MFVAAVALHFLVCCSPGSEQALTSELDRLSLIHLAVFGSSLAVVVLVQGTSGRLSIGPARVELPAVSCRVGFQIICHGRTTRICAPRYPKMSLVIFSALPPAKIECCSLTSPDHSTVLSQGCRPNPLKRGRSPNQWRHQ